MLNNIPAFSRPTLYPGFYFKVKVVDENLFKRATAAVVGKVGAPSEESFEEVTGLSFTIESDSQFINGEHCAIPTKITYSPLILKRAFMSPTSELLTWCMEAMQNKFTKISLKTIIITLMDVNTGMAASQWKVYHAYPLKYQVDGFNSNQSQLLMETIEIRYQKFEVSSLLDKAISILSQSKVGKKIVDNVKTRIKNLETKRDNLIKDAKETATKKADELLDKLTPGFLKTKIDPIQAITDPKELERLRKLAEAAAKKAKDEKPKEDPDKKAEEDKKAEDDKKALAKKLAEEAAKKVTETKPEPKKKEDKKKVVEDKEPQIKKPDPIKPEEKKPDPKKPDVVKKPEEKKPDPKKPDVVKKPEEKKPDPKKPDVVKKPEEKKPDPKKPDVVKKPEEKKPEPKKPEPKKEEKKSPPKQSDREKAAEKKHIENQQKARDKRNGKK